MTSSGSSPGTVAVIGPAASAAPVDTGGGSAYVTSTFNVTPLQGIEAAAGPGTTVQYVQGLPTDMSLSPIPGADLTPAYRRSNSSVPGRTGCWRPAVAGPVRGAPVVPPRRMH
jgi:hypothetical protein